jgi:hypothetical protein
MNYEVAPSVLGRKLIHLMFEENNYGEELLAFAQSGNHWMNPYHNVVHCLQHVYWSNACFRNSRRHPHQLNDIERVLEWPLALASLLHDHNHSGGRYSDTENIKNTLAVLEELRYIFSHGIYTPEIDLIGQLIQVTEFDSVSKGFPNEPLHIGEDCMRDADLMTIYSSEGRDLLIELPTEMGKPVNQMTTHERNDFIDASAKFLRDAKMYTTYGRRVKDLYLESCLKEFAQVVKSIPKV